MKSVFCNFIGRALAGITFPSVLTVALLLGPASQAVDTVWVGAGNITTPPNIDAITISNSAAWNITTVPRVYSSKDTLNYVNKGGMTNSIGWDFSLWPSGSGINAWSANFTNSGAIMALSGLGGPVTQLLPVGYLLVSATNIVNRGSLAADAYSQIILTGSNVDLSRSQIQITPIDHVSDPTSAGLYDTAWAQDTFPKEFNIRTDGMWDGTNFVEPHNYGMTETCGGSDTFGPFQIKVASADSRSVSNAFYFVTVTNIDGVTTSRVLLASNVFRQAVFIGTASIPVSSQIGFVPNTTGTNLFSKTTTILSFPFTNTASGLLDNAQIFVGDRLANATNRGVVVGAPLNPYATCTEPTYRPVNYIFNRATTNQFGIAGDGFPANDYLFPTNNPLAMFTNPFVATMDYAAYFSDIENLTAQFGNGNSATNLPGRVTIMAKNLNMNQSHIRAEGGLVIQADNLVNSVGATVDCQNLSYDLSSTNGLLTVTNLGGLTVNRLHGSVRLWSGVWENDEQLILTNNFDTNGMVVPLTNNVHYNLAVTVIDPSQLSLVVPVGLQSFVSHSTNTVVNDSVTVLNALTFYGTSLTINGGLNMNDNPALNNLNGNAGVLENFDKNTAPNLLYFTNNGALIVPDAVVFGADRVAGGYQAVVNKGIISNATESIDTAYYQNSGVDQVSGAFGANMINGQITGGLINAGQEIDLSGTALKLNNAKLSAGTAINFILTGALFDAGAGASNTISCFQGFNLLTKPASGDLLGTTINSMALNGAEVDSTWAGEDRGTSVTGFSNNVALGTLVLSPQGAFEPLFTFAGTGGTNALYVDVLDLTQLGTDYQNMLAINPNLVIYYASIKIGFTPPTINGISQEPEEYMNGQLDNHLRWVSSFAGPNSSVAVLINGHTVLINRALRFSKLIDSNGNGIPNFFDTTPFDMSPFPVSGSLVTTNQPPVKAFGLSWTAAPNTVYQVQYATNLISPNWLPLLNYTNNTTANVPVTLWDTNAVGTQRFYRESVILQFQ